MRRAISLEGLDKELELSKCSIVNVPDKEFIYLDKLSDGTWRLVYTAETIEDIRNLQALRIIRED